jgi:hypothetical protein
MSVDSGYIINRAVGAPDPGAIVAAAAAMGLDLKVEESEGEPLVFTHGAVKLMVRPIAAPHPDVSTMRRGPLTPPSEVLETAQAHTLVTVLGLEGDPLYRGSVTAALCAAVMAGTSDAVGAMLAEGITIHGAEIFSELAAKSLESGTPPVELLVDVTAARAGDQRMSLLSHGMTRHGREEFLLTCPIEGEGAMGFMFSMVRWMLMDKEKHLASGDAIGRSAEETILVQRVPSVVENGAEVIRLDL